MFSSPAQVSITCCTSSSLSLRRVFGVLSGFWQSLPILEDGGAAVAAGRSHGPCFPNHTCLKGIIMPTKEKRPNVIAELLKPGNWFMFPRYYMFFLQPIDAVVFSYLMKVECWCVEHETTKEEEWFYCTMEKFERDLNISRDQQKRSVARLKELEVIETKLIGMPGRRHFRINWDKVGELVEKHANPFNPTKDED
jgi:hypothetical protein